MSGGGITAQTARRNTPQGIYTRLQSHASGRRNGDQFCVYVADRLVLTSMRLTPFLRWNSASLRRLRNVKGLAQDDLEGVGKFACRATTPV